MPELPEIETIKSVVAPQIQGLAIENVLVNRPEVIAHPTADEFCEDVTELPVNKRSGLPQHSVSASVRSRRRTLPELRKYIVSYGYRR